MLATRSIANPRRHVLSPCSYNGDLCGGHKRARCPASENSVQHTTWGDQADQAAHEHGTDDLPLENSMTWWQTTTAWLVVSTPLKNISQWKGLSHIYIYIMEHKTCSKPPTRPQLAHRYRYPTTSLGATHSQVAEEHCPERLGRNGWHDSCKLFFACRSRWISISVCQLWLFGFLPI